MRYYKFPKWLKRFYPDAVWEIFLPKVSKKTIYLTFDDGPIPQVTPWVLDELKKMSQEYLESENKKLYL